MKSHTTRSFREAFRTLPPDVQAQARRAYRQWRARLIYQGYASSGLVRTFPFVSDVAIVRWGG